VTVDFFQYEEHLVAMATSVLRKQKRNNSLNVDHSLLMKGSSVHCYFASLHES